MDLQDAGGDRSAQTAVDALVELLDLEPIDTKIFRGRATDEVRQRVYGGQVAGQALVAASRTVDPNYSVHSLHSYFLRPGAQNVPIIYLVDQPRDGRSFVTRQVKAIQTGEVIFTLSASFHIREDGLEHQIAPPADVPEPETLPDFHTRMAPWQEEMGEWYTRPRALDTRLCGHTPADRKNPLPPVQNVWVRANGRLPDDPVLHACVVTYLSDMTVLDTSLLPHSTGPINHTTYMASLDHAMWFHRPFRADEWLLYAQDSPSAAGGRGLGRGLIFDRSGDLVVSVVQEGLIRPLRSDR